MNDSLKTPLLSISTPCKLSYKIEEYTLPSSKSSHDLKQSYSWDSLLSEPSFIAAPVSTFKHVSWDQILKEIFNSKMRKIEKL